VGDRVGEKGEGCRLRGVFSAVYGKDRRVGRGGEKSD